MLYNVRERIIEVRNQLLDGEVFYGIETGFNELDNRTGGFRNGDLIVLGSSPSMGKTSLMLNIVSHVSVDMGRTGVVFSMERSADRIFISLIKQRAEIESICSDFDEDQRSRIITAAEELKNSRLFIDDTQTVSVDHIKCSCYEIMRTQNIWLVAIDYLQLIDTGDYENPVRGLNHVIHELKKLATELDCPVLLLSQISRRVETRHDKHPRMSDLRDYGELEEVADEVMLLYRDEYYNRDSDRRGIAELDVRKSKGDMVGVIELVFLPEYQLFQNRKKGAKVL